MRLIYFLALLCVFMRDAAALPSLKAIPADHVLKATFTQHRYLREIPKPIQSQGGLLLWSGKGLIWKTKAPFPSTILLTTKGLYQRDQGQKVPMIKAGQGGHEGALFDMLSKILNGSFAELKGFTMVSMPPSQGKWKVVLTPTQPALKEFISSIEVEGDESISHLIIYRANGDRDDISVQNQKILESSSLSPEEKKGFDE